MNKKTIFFAILASLPLWYLIIFVPPWNPRAIFYVLLLLVIVIAWWLIYEITYRWKHPKYDEQMSKLDTELRKKEGRK